MKNLLSLFTLLVATYATYAATIVVDNNFNSSAKYTVVQEML